MSLNVANDKLLTRLEFRMTRGGLVLIGRGSYPFVRAWYQAYLTDPLVLSQRPVLPRNRTVKSLVFNMSQENITLWDGRRFNGYLISHTFLGPTIRVGEGDNVRVTVNNRGDKPTRLRWHFVNVPFPKDGGPGISQNPIMPGQSFTYELIAGPSGPLSNLVTLQTAIGFTECSLYV